MNTGYISKRLVHILLLTSSIILLFPTPSVAGTKPIGATCSKNAECSTNTCEVSDIDQKGYCVCNAGITADGDTQCAQTYNQASQTASKWACNNGINASGNLNYCQYDGQVLSKFPGPTQSSSGLDILTDTSAAIQLNAEELNKLLKKPSPRITIPGVSFTETSSLPIRSEGDATYIYIPYIGEYIAPVYKYGVAAIALFAVVMIINAGFGFAMSGGNPENINHAKKGITQSLIGLLIAVTSYSLLYLINPELVQFRSLKVKVVESEYLADPSNDEESRVVKSQALAGYTTAENNSRDIAIDDPQNFCFPITEGFDYNSHNWGQARKINGSYVQCHHGLDLYTKGEEGRGTIIAMTDGVVLSAQKSGFTNCTEGRSTKTGPGETESVGMISVYDKTHNMTYVYGEVNGDSIGALKRGDTITKGQQIAIASKCKMLHLEIYEGKGIRRGDKLTLQGTTPKIANWYLYDELNLPELKYGKNACLVAPYFNILDVTKSKLLNPMSLIKQIENNTCQ